MKAPKLTPEVETAIARYEEADAAYKTLLAEDRYALKPETRKANSLSTRRFNAVMKAVDKAGIGHFEFLDWRIELNKAKSDNTLKPEAAVTAQETIEMTEATETKTTKTPKPKTPKPKTPKTAKPKTPKPKTPKTAKTAKPKTNGSAHAFLAAKDEPAKCSVCSGAPSDKRHRRALDRARQVWRTGTYTEKAAHLTRLGFDGSDAKATWTEIAVEVKHLLAAELAKAEAK